MSKISYGCTALIGTTKTGELKPDADGFYTLNLGAFGFHNAAGAYYELDPAVDVLENSPAFRRRIAAGALYAECGHPKFEQGMTKREYGARLSIIEETRHCAFIKKVWMGDQITDKRSGNVGRLVMGLVKPSGQYGPQLAEKLADKDQNVSFSIRSLTMDQYVPSRGCVVKTIKHIETWDYVTEPGIYCADRWNNPGLESLSAINLEEQDFVTAIAEAEDRYSGMESDVPAHLKEINQSIDWSKTSSGLVIPRRSIGGKW